MVTLRINGVIDRNEPDPAAPSDPHSRWIGRVTAAWVGWDRNERSAAILKVATGRGSGDPQWGPHVLVLRWIGDPPPPEVAQAVYDMVRDGGPGYRVIGAVVTAQPATESTPSYRVARA